MTLPLASDESSIPLEIDSTARRLFCRQMLAEVSRTFALVIRLLPPSLSHTVGVSYLVCRIADTMEDQLGLPREERLRLLSELRQALQDPDARVTAVGPQRYADGVRELMSGVNLVLQEFRRLPSTQREAITPWIMEMIDGMASCLPGVEQADEPLFNTLSQLRQYCYFVAGTVGRFLTELFCDQSSRPPAVTRDRLRALAPQFAQTLQLTNILRDVSADAAQHRNHIPHELWREVGLEPSQLFVPGRERESWAVLDPIITEAQQSARAGAEYVTLLPRSGLRVRLFCLTPLLHACRTLTLIDARRKSLASGSAVRMPRREVYGLTLLAALIAPSNSAIRGVFLLMQPSSGSGPLVSGRNSV